MLPFRFALVAGSLAFAFAALTASSARSQTTCTTQWIPTFGEMPGVEGSVRALAVFDDGQGPALYVAGSFLSAGGVAANSIARWDGATWSALGTGTNGQVLALAVFDDGQGPALYAGGSFTAAGGVPAAGVARWNGASWSPLGLGLGTDPDEHVSALAVFDDGSGPALFAGGSFLSAGGLAASRVAKWNGSSWSALGSGTDSEVLALSTFDDGSGNALFAGGSFLSAGGVLARRIAKWNGVGWSALGTGMNQYVACLRAFDDGSGPSLFAGGLFTTAGGAPASQIAKWNGAGWSALGSGTNQPVLTLCDFDDGSGPALFAGGGFTLAGGVSASSVARWNGASWTALGSGATTTVFTSASYDDGHGAKLYFAGQIYRAGSLSVRAIASWSGTSWEALGTGLGNNVHCLESFDDGNGPALYAGGQFAIAGGAPAERVAKWDGGHWSPLGSGVAPSAVMVLDLAVFDDGNGPALYAGGQFSGVAGAPPGHIAKWNGASWSVVGGGVGDPFQAVVYALAVFDDGSGPALYAAGKFSHAGGVPASNIAKWDGASWSPLGAGLDNFVYSLGVFDDGGGPALYAGGMFTNAGGAPASRIAKWNGNNWSPLGSGVDDHVYALHSFDDGSGPALYVGGQFTTAGGAIARQIARWSGGVWTEVGGGVGGVTWTGNRYVHALATFDDSQGAALYAAGSFTTAGGVGANYVARWDGTAWSGLANGMQKEALALAVHDGGTCEGSSLCIGGRFANTPAHDSFVARWGCPAECPTSFCLADGSTPALIACPCANTGAAGRGCDNSAGTGGARLATSGSPAGDTLVLTADGEISTALSIFLQGNATSSAGIVFGDGVRCVAGTLKRLYVKSAVGGVVSAPEAGDPSVRQQSANLGDPIAPGSQRWYQVYYRDANAIFCPPPSGNTWNVSGGVEVQW